MTNTARRGSDYTDPHTHSFATEGAATPPTKKKSKFMQVLIFSVGILFLVFAGFVGWGMISKKPTPAPASIATPVETPAPKPDLAINPDTTIVDPAAVPIDPALTSVDPSSMDAARVDPATGLQAAPENPLDPAVPAIASSAPMGSTAAPNAAPVITDPVVPVAAPVIATPSPAVAVVNDPASTGLSDVMNGARQEMMRAMDRIEKRLQEMESRFSTLDARVSGLEKGSPIVAPRLPTTTRKSVVRKKRPATVPVQSNPARSAPQNRLEILDSGSSAPVSRAIIIDGRIQPENGNRIEVVNAPPAVVRPSAGTASCSIRSIQPGRVWIRRANGSFATYGVGDSLPDGRRVDSIDPNAGVMAGGRAWSCG